MIRKVFIVLYLMTYLVCKVRNEVFSRKSFREYKIKFDNIEKLVILKQRSAEDPSISSIFINIGQGSVVFVDKEACYLQDLPSKKLLKKFKAITGGKKELLALKHMTKSVLSRFKALFAIQEVYSNQQEGLLNKRELAACDGKALWRTSLREPLLPTFEDYLSAYRENRTAWLLTNKQQSKSRVRRDVYLSKRKRRKLSKAKRKQRKKRRKAARLQADDSSLSSTQVKIDRPLLSPSKSQPKEGKGFIHYKDFYRETPEIENSHGKQDPLNNRLGGSVKELSIPAQSLYINEEERHKPYTGKVKQEGIEFPKMIFKDGTIFYRHDAPKEESNASDSRVPLFPVSQVPISSDDFANEILEGPYDRYNEIQDQYIPGIESDTEDYSQHIPSHSGFENIEIQTPFDGDQKAYVNGFDFISSAPANEIKDDELVTAIASAKRENNGMSAIAVGKANLGGYFEASAHGYNGEAVSHSQVKGDKTGVSGVASMTLNSQNGQTQVHVKSPYGSSAAFSNSDSSSISSALVENRSLDESKSSNYFDIIDQNQDSKISYRDTIPIERTLSAHSYGGRDYGISSSLEADQPSWHKSSNQVIDHGGLLVGAGNAPRESEIEQIRTGIYNEGGSALSLAKQSLQTNNAIHRPNKQTAHITISPDIEFQPKQETLTNAKIHSKKEDGAVGVVTFPHGEVGSPPGPGELLRQKDNLLLESSFSPASDLEEAFYSEYLDGLENDPVFSKDTSSKEQESDYYGSTENKTLSVSLVTPSYQQGRFQLPTSTKVQLTHGSGVHRTKENTAVTMQEPQSAIPQIDITPNENLFAASMDLTEDLMPDMKSIVVPVELPEEELLMPAVPPGEEGTLQRLEPLDPNQPVINVLTIGTNDNKKAFYQRQGSDLQPGEKIPGAPGFIVPPGFRGKVVYGHSLPIEIDSKKTVQGYNTNIRVQPQAPPSGYPVYASVSGPQASKYLNRNHKPGVHITLGSTFPQRSSSYNKKAPQVYKQPHGLVGPQIPGTNLDYNKVTHPPRNNLPRKSWTAKNTPYRNSWNTQWSSSWNNGYNQQHMSPSNRESCGYYTNNCKTTHGPYQTMRICKPLFIEVACCC